MQIQKLEKPLEIDLPRVCDVCHRIAPLRWLDYDQWACDDCAYLYLLQLRLRG